MESLKSELRRAAGCEISDDPFVRRYYSADASFYRIEPEIVVFPKTESEIIRTVKFAKKRRIAITPRGAGTGLVGGALGRQIVMDLKRMNWIRIQKKSVTVGPGVIKGVLDERLQGCGKFLAPDPSVGKYCTIGGMVGTNASGIHALKYGSVIDNMQELTLIDGNGDRVRIPHNKEVAGKILDIARRADLDRFPDTSKNSCGYRLDAVRKMADAHKAFAGSEGTLGIITSAKFMIRDIPKRKSLSAISYKNPDDVHMDVNRIVKMSPSALEYMDECTIRNIDYRFASGTASVLLVEFDEEIGEKLAELDGSVVGKVEFSTTDDGKIQKWWGHRSSALAYSLRTMAENDASPHIVEDAAVHVGRLKDLLDAVGELNSTYKTKAVVYGHAGNGNLHVRLAVKGRSEEILTDVAGRFFERILDANGTITAEHGDGIARSGFVRRQYGARNHRLFWELKRALDPAGILNPGKIMVRKSQMAQNPECQTEKTQAARPP